MIIKIGNKPYELATKEEVMEYLREAFYPVGSIYLSMNPAFDPNVIFGGQWELLKEGIFIEATQDKNKVGKEIQAGLPDASFQIRGHIRIFDASNGILPNTLTRLPAIADSYGPSIDRGQAPNNIGGGIIELSKLNPIYGNSRTVQPNALCAFVWTRTG